MFLLDAAEQFVHVKNRRIDILFAVLAQNLTKYEKKVPENRDL